MLVGNNWKIESDSLNVILMKKVKRKKKGTDETYDDWKNIGYYSNFENAFKAMVDQRIRDTDLTDIKSINKAILDMKKEIDVAMKEVVK